MKNIFAAIFGPVIAFILLILYAGLVVYIIWEVLTSASVNPENALEFPGVLISVVTTIGGLVSALVVMTLTNTKPMENPSLMRFAVKDDGEQSKLGKMLVWAYLSTWLIVGSAALLVGMLHPQVNQTLKDIGTTWLGLAVASASTYLGIKP